MDVKLFQLNVSLSMMILSECRVTLRLFDVPTVHVVHILLYTLLGTGVFPDNFKSSSVIPLLKKYNLDKEDLSNYRPISHLSFLSKLTERVVKNRLTQHLSSNNLLNSSSLPTYKHHSTESTLLAVHDHIIKAMSQQKVTALCLLDLSAAFDTIDHSILLHRLSSWFGLSGIRLSLGSHNTWHLEVLLSVLTPLSPISFHSIREFLKDLPSVLCSSFFTPPPSVFLSQTHHVVIIFMLMTLNYSFPSLLLISPPTSYAYKLQLTLSPTGCLQISSHSIKLKLSFSSSVYLLSSLKSLIPLYLCLLM